MTLRLDASSTDPDFLERGAESVVRDFPPELLFTQDRATLRAVLSSVSEDIRSTMAGHPPDRTDPTPMDRLDLLRRLRRAVLDAWSRDDGLLLEVMRAFEVTERSLMASEGSVMGRSVGPGPRGLLREVGHLLRSPLGSVVLLTETLLEERSGTLNTEQRRQMQIVHRAAVSAATSAGDLLTLTDPTDDVLEARPFSVAETVSAVADMVRPVTEARHSELVVDQSVEGRRRGPAVAVGRALLGMTVPAALMTPDGRVEIRTSAIPGDTVVFTVTAAAGDGASLGEAAADPLRLYRTSPGADGYTLSPEGLAFNAARSIVRSMGSELEIETSEGESLVLRYRLGLPIL